MADFSVGPVLLHEPVGEAVLQAIAAADPQAELIDRGAYVRVLTKGRCGVSRAAIEARLGREVLWPGDLEAVMPSWKGRLRITRDEVWWLPWAEKADPQSAQDSPAAEGKERQ